MYRPYVPDLVVRRRSIWCTRVPRTGISITPSATRTYIRFTRPVASARLTSESSCINTIIQLQSAYDSALVPAGERCCGRRAAAGARAVSPLRRRYATAPTVAEDEQASLVPDERRQGLLRRTFLDYMPHSAFEANPGR